MIKGSGRARVVNSGAYNVCNIFRTPCTVASFSSHELRKEAPEFRHEKTRSGNCNLMNSTCVSGWRASSQTKHMDLLKCHTSYWTSKARDRSQGTYSTSTNFKMSVFLLSPKASSHSTNKGISSSAYSTVSDDEGENLPGKNTNLQE